LSSINSVKADMQININSLKKINYTKIITPAAFIGVCAYQSCMDYKKADRVDRKKVITKDILIMGGTLVGIVSAKKLISSASNVKIIKNIADICQNKTCSIKNIVKNKFGYTEKTLKVAVNVMKDTAEELFATFCGIVFAVGIGDFLAKKKLFYVKPKEKGDKIVSNPLTANYDFYQNPDTGVESVSKIFQSMGLNSLARAEGPLSALAGYSVSAQQGIENRIKQTSYELIANAAIPTFVISAVGRSTKNLPAWSKFLIYPSSALAGLFMGHKAGMWFDKEVTQEVTDEIREHKKDNQPVTFKDIKIAVKNEFFD